MVEETPMSSASLRAVLSLSRPHTCFAAAVEVYLGIFLVGGWDLWRTALIAGLAIMSIVAAGNAYNDAQDADADLISSPQRPIPSGRLSRRSAYLLSCLFAGTAVVIAFTLNSSVGILSLVLIVSSFGYTSLLKKIPILGNFTVALATSGAILFGALSVDRYRMLLILPMMGVLLYLFGFEVLKTIRDIEGDESVGTSTVATRWGIEAALRIAEGAFAALIGSLILFGLASSLRILYYAFVALGVIPIIVLSLGVLRLYPVDSKIRWSLKLLRLGWLPALCAMFLLY
jgi:geranylgeranylglycerol-phosphate geranylgeranyltransferase